MPERTDPPAERHREVETKLDADAGFALPALAGNAALLAAGLPAAGPATVLDLAATYFDTDAWDLLRARRTLRRRTGGDDAGWHLKLPADAGARTEVRLPLSAGGGTAGDGANGDEAPGDEAAGDEAPVPTELATLVREVTRGRRLRPVARIQTRRTVRELLDAAGAGQVELADDEVTGIALPHGIPQRWRELEVELTAGTSDHLAAVTRLLLAAGARPAGHASKLGRLLAETDPRG